MNKPIKIGIDIRDLRKASSGTKTCLEELCLCFRNSKNTNFVYIFLDDPLPVYTGQSRLLKLAEQVQFQYWKQIVLPLLAWIRKCDIVFCTDYFVPYLHLWFKTIPVFHDAFFFEYPEQYHKTWLWLFKKIAIPAAQRASCIVTPSQYAAKQVCHFTGFNKQKIRVVYEAPKTLSTLIHPAQSNIRTEIQILPGKKYILHVGTFSKNKNLVRLVNAFQHLIETYKHADVILVLAGKASPHFQSNDLPMVEKQIQKSELTERVILTGYLNQEELALLYQYATLYVFPSINEGFGIPALEAFAFGIPVAAANYSCLPEICGDAALYFDPFDEKDIAQKLNDLLNDRQKKEALVIKGNKRKKHFSWKKAADEIETIFLEVQAGNTTG